MKKIFVIIFILVQQNGFAQDVACAKKIVDSLASTYMWGRGYTKDGMKKAADFLKNTFECYGLKPLKGKSYFQKFNYDVNTFPGEMELSINNKNLTPGEDFIVSPESRSIIASGKFQQADSTQYINEQNRLIVEMVPKLTWSVAGKTADYTMLHIQQKAITETPETFTINIAQKLIKNFEANNVAGMVKGTERPDSFIFITAHYDHLGGMGKDTYFPGANDNASGVALLLSLAKYYATNPAKYSIVFICFAGEEAGLIGSKYYTENPLLPLKKIRFLINTDLAGTGEEGITVVNATEFPNEFKWMQEINEENHLLKAVNPRGKAANSDHYFFTEKGVPSFFFYTLGGVTAYHDVFDKAQTLPLTKHKDLFTLIKLFNEKLMGQ